MDKGNFRRHGDFDGYIARRPEAFTAAYVAYVGFYLVRNNTKILSGAISSDLGWSNQQIGWILTAFAATYGIGKLVMGIVVDRTNIRGSLTWGLVVSAAICLAMGTVSSLPTMFVLIAMLGIAQGLGAPASLAMIGSWYPNAERGARVAVWNTSQNLGASLLPLLIAGSLLLAGPHRWRVGYIAPAILVVAIACWVHRHGINQPWREGLPTLTSLYGAAAFPRLPPTPTSSYWNFVRVYVLSSRLLWILAAVNALLYFARFGIVNWIPIYLRQQQGYSSQEAYLVVAVLEWAAIPGSLVFAVFAWKWPRQSATIGCVSVLGLSASIWSYAHAPGLSQLLIAAGALGALLYGPQIIVNILTLNFVPARATGIAVGWVGLGGYLLGEVGANLLIPWVEVHFGWDATFVLLSAGCVLAAALYASLRGTERQVVVVSE